MEVNSVDEMDLEEAVEALRSGGGENLANSMLSARIEAGKANRETDRRKTLGETPGEELEKQVQMEVVMSKHEPAWRPKLDEEVIDTLARLALEGENLLAMASATGMNPPQARLAMRDPRVQARIDELAAETVKASSRLLKASAMKAVHRMIKVMETSESDKLVLSAARDIIKLAGVESLNEAEGGGDGGAGMSDKTTEKLVDILKNVLGGPNG